MRDATAQPEPGAYSICYVNGFQTQPGERELFPDELLLRGLDGKPVVDPEWPDEFVLDPSSPQQRQGILDRVGPVIAGCADHGFDAVEIDNLDTFTRFEQIDQDGALELARSYVSRAHDRGLAVGQKNTAEITRAARDELGFDLAVTEECGAFDECAAYTGVYGEHVLQIEYPDTLADAGTSFDEVCRLRDRAPHAILRDRALAPAGAEGHLYEACP